MADNDLKGYLDQVQTTKDVRAGAWEAYNHSADQSDFQKRFDALDLPKNVKAQLWESKFGGKGLGAPAAAPVAVPKAAPQPQALTPPTGHPDDKGMLSKVWDWANSPVNLGHIRSNIDQAEAYSNSAPTLDEANHPYTTLAKKAVEGFSADAAKMLLTPLGIGMAAAGPVARGAGTAANVAKAGLAAAGIGFGAQGGIDLAKNGVTPQENEKPEDYVRRVGGDAAMVLGGVAGAVESSRSVSRLAGSTTPRGSAKPDTVPTPTPEPETASSAQSASQPQPQSQSNPNEAAFTTANARKARAIGGNKPSVTKTVYVDRDFANELSAWNENDKLTGKRVILRKNGTVDLAHLDPDTERFTTTEAASNNAFSEEGAEGQVPVELSTTNGKRGTATPGHFLSAQVVGESPKATAPTPVEQPSAPISEAAVEQPVGGVGPGIADTPAPIPEAIPSQQKSVTVDRPVEKRLSPQKRATVPEQPIQSEGPARTEMLSATAEKSAPPVDVSKLEDKIRPLVGQALRLSQLKLGEAASHTIDLAIEHSRESGGEIPEDVAEKVSRLLQEPVGKSLTPDQELKLEKLRGGQMSNEAEIEYPKRGVVENIRAGEHGEEYEARLAKSQDAMMAAYADPETSPELRAKLEEALTPDSKNRMKYALYEPKVQYPKPEALSPDHPEAPFTAHRFTHQIVENTLENQRAAMGGHVRQKNFDTSRTVDKYVTPEERAKLNELAADIKGPGGNPSFTLGDILGTSENAKGSVFQGKETREFREYNRQLQQKVLDRKLDEIHQQINMLAGEWNGAKGAESALAEQLSKLSDEAKLHLPEKLFNGEFNQAPSPGEAASANKLSAATKRAKASPTGTRSGQETGVFGVVTTKYEGLIEKNFPHAAAAVDSIRQNIEGNFGAMARQKAYANAMKTLYSALDKEDPYAVKKGIDASNYTGPKELNAGIGLIPDRSGLHEPYKPEDLHLINASTADAILRRYEEMSASELAKKKDGLWKDSLVNRIDGAVPTSNDPEFRADQAETYAELVERHNELKRRVGPASTLSDRLFDVASLRRAVHDQAAAKRIMREVQGPQARNNAILKTSFQQLDNLMEQLPLPEQDRFFDNMSRGASQVPDVFSAIDPEKVRKWENENGPVPDPNEVASAIREAFDAARERVAASSGNLQEFLLNYMPGMYDNQAKARRFAESWTSRRPLAGNSDFLKQKVYEFHLDALNAGLQPVTSNPVRAMLMRVEQLNRYSMAHDMKNRFIDYGLTEFYADGETPPEGHVQLNDRIFGQGGMGGGGYYAPDSVAKVFNNFVSQGLRGKWRIPYTNFSLFDAIKHTNGTANMFQLGLSLFHGMETVANSGFGTMALGLRQAINQGQVLKGAGNIVKGLTFVAPIVEDGYNGAKGLANFRDPTKNLNYAELGNDLERANANVITNPQFELDQINRFKKNWATATDDIKTLDQKAFATVKAAGNLLAAGVEATSWPLMKYLIPRVKIGAFYRMAQEIHEEMAGEHPDAITEQLQSAWDSVDNRFGEINHDNIFLSRTAKDIMQLGVRSPGWNIGTIREVGGGVWDLGSTVKDAATGKGFKISNRTAYTASMVAGTMFFNALYQYLHPKAPKPEGVDYVFPQDGTKSVTGEVNRVYPKTYMYDFINLYHDPTNTVWHKAAPDIATMSDIIRNQDYYHRIIRDPADNPIKQAASTLAYLGHQFIPFSFGNLAESTLRNQTSKAEAFLGILPAPRWVGRTSAENLAFDYKNAEDPQGALDSSDLERKRTFVDLRNKVARGEISEDQIGRAIEQGKMPPKMAKYLFSTVNKPQLQTWTEGLQSPAHVMKVWEAASPEEKKLLFPTVVKKVLNKTSGEEQQRLITELQEFSDKHPD